MINPSPYQLFDLLTPEEYEALKDDIRERGVLVPVELDEHGHTLDGHHRIRAWEELCAEGVDLADYPRIIRPGLSEEQKRNHVRALNLKRRHLTKDQRAKVFADMRTEGATLQEIADATGVSHMTVKRTLDDPALTNVKAETVVGKDGKAYPASYKPRVGTPAIFTQSSLLLDVLAEVPDEVRDVALRAGVHDASAVQQLANAQAKGLDTYKVFAETGALDGHIPGDELTGRDIERHVEQAHQEHQAAAAEEARERRKIDKRRHAQSLPEGIYNVIYADPAWQYDNTGVHGAAEPHYDTMPTEDIYALPEKIGLCVDANAILFLWTTNAFLAEGMECVQRWGFTYKSNAVWVKTDLVKPGSGWYLRGRHELLLIATRGSFTPLDEHISPPIGSVIVAPLQDHSHKPEEVYGVIERLYPDCNYVELFARRSRQGWVSWGDEVDADS